jgi:hypothetical protein
MSSEPLLNGREDDDFEMTTKDNVDDLANVEEVDGRHVIRPASIDNPENDPDAPSYAVPSRKQRLSDLFTILCAGCALISDGYANSLMTLINVVLGAQYPKQYVSAVSTRVSNALLVGEICGQITIGFVSHSLSDMSVC